LLSLVEDFEDLNLGAVVKVRVSIAGGDEEEMELDWSETTPPSMTRIAIVDGEVAYNTHASLDYFVYALAWLDSGSEVTMTQFPIDETKETFTKHIPQESCGKRASQPKFRAQPDTSLASSSLPAGCDSRGPSRKYVFIGPLPFTSIKPLSSSMKRADRRAAARSVTWMDPETP
jgi:hypothetical protein